jgi:CHAT domain-containing protein
VEGEHIAGVLGVQPWLEGEALEARLKGSPSPRILHIATHGFFLENREPDPNQNLQGLDPVSLASESPLGRLIYGMENPLLRSGLALAGANSWLAEMPVPAEAEDGILTAEDVTGLNLLDTELVVLSACETGLGAVQVGEGVLGLRRSFVVAGAQTLVMSLWKVPDQQTQELMEDYYRRILDGLPRADALREAQLAMKARHPEPRYWGAFICEGDPGRLALSEGKNMVRLCTNCGTQLKDGASFCTKCGTRTAICC